MQLSQKQERPVRSWVASQMCKALNTSVRKAAKRKYGPVGIQPPLRTAALNQTAVKFLAQVVQLLAR